MINITYSKLLKGVNHGAASYQRKVDSTVGLCRDAVLADILVTPAADKAYMNYQADQLVQICRKSLLNAALQASDPVNTYSSEFMPAAPYSTFGGTPAGLICRLQETSARHTWTALAGTVRVQPALNTATVDGISTYPINMTDGLSAPITLAGDLTLRLSGTLPTDAFTITTDIARIPCRDMAQLIEDLRKHNIIWLPAFRDYRNSLDINDWIAAIVLNHCASEA